MKILVGIFIFLITANNNQACKTHGKVYRNGDTWIYKNFVFVCEKYTNGSWRAEITACLAPGGFRLLVGTEFIEAGMNYTCTRKPGGVVEFAFRSI